MITPEFTSSTPRHESTAGEDMRRPTLSGVSIQIFLREFTRFSKELDKLHFMTSLRKKIATAFIATALIVPTTTSIASAQSSFVSGSSSSDETPGTNQGSKVNQLKEAFEQAVIANGQIKSPAAEASAKKLLQRALSYELYYQNDVYESLEYSPASFNAVMRIPANEIDERIASIGGEIDTDGFSFPFGAAAGKDANYYYLAFVLQAG